jgi:hypothetical protein
MTDINWSDPYSNLYPGNWGGMRDVTSIGGYPPPSPPGETAHIQDPAGRLTDRVEHLAMDCKALENRPGEAQLRIRIIPDAQRQIEVETSSLPSFASCILEKLRTVSIPSGLFRVRVILRPQTDTATP